METFWSLINELKENLAKPLPGLAAQQRMSPSHRGEPIKLNGEANSFRNSAVLIPLFPINGIVSTLLIKRSTYNGIHSGQVSFPGGKFEKSDLSFVDTALRESQEEVDINPKDVEVLGTLTPLYIPVSNLQVLPVVGLIKEKPSLLLNAREVEYPITVSIEHLKNPKNHLVTTIYKNNLEIKAPYFRVGNEQIWGATAMIIAELIELIPEK